MKRILITGGAGFVGSSLALRFRTEWPGAAVMALDNLYRKGSELNAARLRRAGVEVVKGDVRRREDLDLPPFDLVVDAAAEPSVLAGSRNDVAYVVDTNLGGTLHILECCRRWAARLVFLSTSRVYPVEALRSIRLTTQESRFAIAPGGQPVPGVTTDGISEAFPLDGPRTLYGATKYASEVMVREYAAQFGLRVVVDRCGVLAGPWQMGRVDQGIVGLWVASHHFGLPLRYIGYDGKQVRDALHIEDLADLVVKQVTDARGGGGEVFNVGGGPGIAFSLRELTQLVQAATGRALAIPFDAAVRPGDVPLYVTDTARVRARFGWDPARDMRAIVADTVQWVRENEEQLRPVFAPNSGGSGKGT